MGQALAQRAGEQRRSICPASRRRPGGCRGLLASRSGSASSVARAHRRSTVRTSTSTRMKSGVRSAPRRKSPSTCAPGRGPSAWSALERLAIPAAPAVLLAHNVPAARRSSRGRGRAGSGRRRPGGPAHGSRVQHRHGTKRAPRRRSRTRHLGDQKGRGLGLPLPYPVRQGLAVRPDGHEPVGSGGRTGPCRHRFPRQHGRRIPATSATPPSTPSRRLRRGDVLGHRLLEPEPGHSYTWSWLGAALQATQRCADGQLPRPRPALSQVISAQAMATLARCPGPLPWVAVGSGEALNEHVTAIPGRPRTSGWHGCGSAST